MKEMKQTATPTALGTVIFARRTPQYLVTVTEFASGALTASVYPTRPAGISGLGHASTTNGVYNGMFMGEMPQDVRAILASML